MVNYGQGYGLETIAACIIGGVYSDYTYIFECVVIVFAVVNIHRFYSFAEIEILKIIKKIIL